MPCLHGCTLQGFALWFLSQISTWAFFICVTWVKYGCLSQLQICYARGEMISLRCAGIYVMPEVSGIQSSNLGNCCIIQLSEDMSNHPFKPWAETASLGRAMAAKACPVFDAKKNVEWHTRLRWFRHQRWGQAARIATLAARCSASSERSRVWLTEKHVQYILFLEDASMILLLSSAQKTLDPLPHQSASIKIPWILKPSALLRKSAKPESEGNSTRNRMNIK